jgi:hypothetical protein
MRISGNDKHKDYTHYASHCLSLTTAAIDRDSRVIQREMAAEWLKLADAMRYPPKSEEVI